MFSRCLSLILAAGVASMAADQRVLRVCADPNNLPFSNERGEGFENKLAELVARDLGAKLEYTWWSQRKSFIKNSLGEGRCDVLMGVPTALDSVAVTKPYYNSTYVFVWRKSRGLTLSSLSDPRLEKFKIGIHVVGDDYAPPAVALGRRGLAPNLVSYSLFGAYGEENPPARLLDAVARGDVDLGIVWGPLAGYFAKREKEPLELAPVSPAMYLAVPFTYEMSMAVRKGDDELKAELDRALDRNCAAVRAILKEYGVPQVAVGGKQTCVASRESLSVSSH